VDRHTAAGSFPPGAIEEIPKLDKLTGSFVDSTLEKVFERENYEQVVRRYVRFAIPLASVSFLTYGVHDFYVAPEIHVQAWLIRYLFFLPIAVIEALFVLKNTKVRWHQPAMLVYGLAVNAVVIWIGALAKSGAAYFIYTGYAVIFVTLGPFLARMNVRTQLVYTALSILMYLGFDALVAHATLVHRFSFVMTLTVMGLIGALTARQLEIQARLAYLQKRVIRDQMAALEQERYRSESLLLNVLPRKIAQRLKNAPDKIIADKFENVSVLFSDIVGFTEMSARFDAETIVKRLDEVFSSFDTIAEQLGLEKIKTIGDAYMVAGGIPAPRSDHAEAVCEMALRMREVIAQLAEKSSEPIRIRIGVHTGPVVAGVIGKHKFIYDVWGDTVNSASRMESHGVPGAIQVSEATYEATKDQFEYEHRGVITVKGKGDMPTYLLLRRRDANESGERAAIVA
jgi:class 3 adenylate cyclase